MNIVPLSILANQSLSIQLGEDFYDIAINQTRNTVCATISRNNALVISGTRLVSGFFIIPYRYLENGNFILLTENDELPDYTKFGITQTLVYVTKVEVSLARAGT